MSQCRRGDGCCRTGTGGRWHLLGRHAEPTSHHNDYTSFPIFLKNDCFATGVGRLAYAAWFVVNARTDEPVGVLEWDFVDGGGMANSWLDWYDDEQGFGTFYVEPFMAYDEFDNELEQNAPNRRSQGRL